MGLGLKTLRVEFRSRPHTDSESLVQCLFGPMPFGVWERMLQESFQARCYILGLCTVLPVLSRKPTEEPIHEDERQGGSGSKNVDSG